MENEIIIKNSPAPVDIEGTKTILNQMMNCICKIKINATNGTGFFCKIPYQNGSMKVLMTNYHVLDDIYYRQNKDITLFLNDDKEVKIINFGIERKSYFNIYYDISMIEIKENDNINNYLELDDNLFKDETQAYYKDISIYTLHYIYGNKASVSYGLTIKIDDFEIKQKCSTEHGSSGSPILNLSNNKVIGIHKQGSKKFNFNLGTCLKFPLTDFYKKKNLRIASNINNKSFNVNNSNINKKLLMIDLFNDMKNIWRKGQPKKIVIFKTEDDEIFPGNFSHGTTIDQILKYYLRRMNRTEFIGTNKIAFLFNGTQIKFGNKTPVEIYFRTFNYPSIKVHFNFSSNGLPYYGNWCNWTKEEEEEIKKEEKKFLALEN